MSYVFVSTCLFLLGATGAMVQPDKLSQQEAFFLKRMTEFWKDRDYTLVKKQVEEFLAAHPQSPIHDNLYAILADILYQEHSYKLALTWYEKIDDTALKQKTITRKCQCLYLMGNYDAVIVTLTPLLEDETQKIEYKEESQFLLADSLVRKFRGLEEGQKKELALKAKPLLLTLHQTSYREKVLLPLAEVHLVLSENQEAAALYSILAAKMPDKKEEILLQVATLQMSFNRNAAIETYQQVVDLGQSRAPDAAYNELLLLFQDGRFSDLVSRASQLSNHLPADKKTLFEFCLARSHFKLENLSEAVAHFESFIQAEPENNPYKRSAFLTLLACAEKTADIDLFDRALEQFLTAFPMDEEAGKALLLHAQKMLQKGDVDQATADLGRLLKDFPDFPDKETLLYDHALLLSKTKKWDESRVALLSYLNRFPQTAHFNAIWSTIVHCSVQELKETSSVEKKGQLVSDLQQALAYNEVFSSEEQPNYQFLYGQLLFDLKNDEKALAQLTTFTHQYPDHASIPQALLLQAHLHRELQSPPEVFIPIAEKALTAATDQENKTALRLQLFNTYLSIKEYEKAAGHLYQSHVVDQVPVQQENQLWLAHYYLGEQNLERATLLFKKVLQTDDNYALHFNPEHTYLETEALKFAEILSPENKKRVLSSLREFQVNYPSQPWKLQSHILFELGKLHLSLNEPDDALKMFDELIGVSESPSYLSNAALLEKSRILFSRCPECDRNEMNGTMTNILSTLKDLQIQKKLTCEPLHLEAALEYADIRISLSSPEARRDSALFFLNRVKDDFNAKDDPIAQEYHEERIRFPDKDRLYQNYMKCIDAEIHQLESQLAEEQNDAEKAKQSQEIAAALLKEILEDTHLTPYLKNRVETLRR